MARVVSFRITAEEPERAAAFYREVLGWRVEPDDAGFRLTTGDEGEPGIDGSLVPREAEHENVMPVVAVRSLDETLARVVELGGEVVKERTPLPGRGFTAVCVDTEENEFTLFEADVNAR